MKKTDFTQIVENNKDKTESEIAAILLSEGATLPLINQLLNRTLVELGMKVDSRKALNIVRKEIAKSPKQVKTYRDLRVWAEVLCEKHNVEYDAVASVIRKYLKEKNLAAPNKLNLGIIKSTIVDYFQNNDTPEMDELAEVLVNEARCEPDDALRHARQNFSFALLLHRNQCVSDVN